MATSSYQLIQSVILTTTSSTITLGSGGTIPATYNDLLIKTSLRSNVSSGVGANAYLTFNGTSTGYSEKLLYNINSAIGAASASNAYITWGSMHDSNNNTSNTFGIGEIYIPNYISNTYKTLCIGSASENNTANDAYMSLDAAIWSNVNAITSITFTTSGTSFAPYSSIYLYGIKNS